MGLDRIKKTPCGFCFVEYYDRRHAMAAVAHLSGTKLDGSVIRVELDAGFQAGRQYGRGASGGQVRHDRKEQRKRSRFGSEDVSGPPSSSNTNNSADGPTNEAGGEGADDKDEGYYGPEGNDDGGGGDDDDDNDESMEPSAKRQRL